MITNILAFCWLAQLNFNYYFIRLSTCTNMGTFYSVKECVKYVKTIRQIPDFALQIRILDQVYLKN